MKNFHYIIAVALILTIICCESPTESSKDMRILPIKVGNYWIYNKYNIKDKDSLVMSGIDTMKVLNDTVVNHLRFYYINYLGRVTDFAYINDSLFCYVDPNYKYLKPSPVYLYPCKTGEIYLTDFGMCKVENNDTTITVFAGKFKCVKYQFSALMGEGNGFEYYHYCSPGIGLIKTEYYHNSYSEPDVYSKMYETELIKYSITD